MEQQYVSSKVDIRVVNDRSFLRLIESAWTPEALSEAQALLKQVGFISLQQGTYWGIKGSIPPFFIKKLDAMAQAYEPVHASSAEDNMLSDDESTLIPVPAAVADWIDSQIKGGNWEELYEHLVEFVPEAGSTAYIAAVRDALDDALRGVDSEAACSLLMLGLTARRDAIEDQEWQACMGRVRQRLSLPVEVEQNVTSNFALTEPPDGIGESIIVSGVRYTANNFDPVANQLLLSRDEPIHVMRGLFHPVIRMDVERFNTLRSKPSAEVVEAPQTENIPYLNPNGVLRRLFSGFHRTPAMCAQVIKETLSASNGSPLSSEEQSAMRTLGKACVTAIEKELGHDSNSYLGELLGGVWTLLPHVTKACLALKKNDDYVRPRVDTLLSQFSPSLLNDDPELYSLDSLSTQQWLFVANEVIQYICNFQVVAAEKVQFSPADMQLTNHPDFALMIQGSDGQYGYPNGVLINNQHVISALSTLQTWVNEKDVITPTQVAESGQSLAQAYRCSDFFTKYEDYWLANPTTQPQPGTLDDEWTVYQELVRLHEGNMNDAGYTYRHNSLVQGVTLFQSWDALIQSGEILGLPTDSRSLFLLSRASVLNYAQSHTLDLLKHHHQLFKGALYANLFRSGKGLHDQFKYKINGHLIYGLNSRGTSEFVAIVRTDPQLTIADEEELVRNDMNQLIMDSLRRNLTAGVVINHSELGEDAAKSAVLQILRLNGRIDATSMQTAERSGEEGINSQFHYNGVTIGFGEVQRWARSAVLAVPTIGATVIQHWESFVLNRVWNALRDQLKDESPTGILAVALQVQHTRSQTKLKVDIRSPDHSPQLFQSLAERSRLGLALSQAQLNEKGRGWRGFFLDVHNLAFPEDALSVTLNTAFAESPTDSGMDSDEKSVDPSRREDTGVVKGLAIKDLRRLFMDQDYQSFLSTLSQQPELLGSTGFVKRDSVLKVGKPSQLLEQGDAPLVVIYKTLLARLLPPNADRFSANIDAVRCYIDTLNSLQQELSRHDFLMSPLVQDGPLSCPDILPLNALVKFNIMQPLRRGSRAPSVVGKLKVSEGVLVEAANYLKGSTDGQVELTTPRFLPKVALSTENTLKLLGSTPIAVSDKSAVKKEETSHYTTVFEVVRQGPQYRAGDVDEITLISTFGLSGIEYGISLPQKERRAFLNNAFDTLYDLSRVLGIKPLAMGLNGELGLCFGSRGRGGRDAALAHFEPKNMAINLTRGQGAGSFSHEYFHAIANHFAKRLGVGNDLTVAMQPKPRINPAQLEASYRERLKLSNEPDMSEPSLRAFAHLVQSIIVHNSGELGARSFGAQLARERSGESEPYVKFPTSLSTDTTTATASLRAHVAAIIISSYLPTDEAFYKTLFSPTGYGVQQAPTLFASYHQIVREGLAVIVEDINEAVKDSGVVAGIYDAAHLTHVAMSTACAGVRCYSRAIEAGSDVVEAVSIGLRSAVRDGLWASFPSIPSFRAIRDNLRYELDLFTWPDSAAKALVDVQKRLSNTLLHNADTLIARLGVSEAFTGELARIRPAVLESIEQHLPETPAQHTLLDCVSQIYAARKITEANAKVLTGMASQDSVLVDQLRGAFHNMLFMAHARSSFDPMHSDIHQGYATTFLDLAEKHTQDQEGGIVYCLSTLVRNGVMQDIEDWGGKREYYGSTCELFARAMETWVARRLAEEGNVNTYAGSLEKYQFRQAAQHPRDNQEQGEELQLYPAGEHLDVIDAAAQGFFSTLQQIDRVSQHPVLGEVALPVLYSHDLALRDGAISERISRVFAAHAKQDLAILEFGMYERIAAVFNVSLSDCRQQFDVAFDDSLTDDTGVPVAAVTDTARGSVTLHLQASATAFEHEVFHLFEARLPIEDKRALNTACAPGGKLHDTLVQLFKASCRDHLIPQLHSSSEIAAYAYQEWYAGRLEDQHVFDVESTFCAVVTDAERLIDVFPGAKEQWQIKASQARMANVFQAMRATALDVSTPFPPAQVRYDLQ